jgi:pimeloyl-ACP methyl ester carboxylesterase
MGNGLYWLNCFERTLLEMSILVDGLIVHYESLGRGRPVIFLHGWIGSWRYWFGSMQVISRSFRAYALDLCGFGESGRDPKRYTLDGQTELLSRFLDEMSLGKVALIGHGLGALVGFSFCVRWPQRVDRMMAVSCPMFHDTINPRLRTSPIQDLVTWLGNRSPEATALLADATIADPQAVTTSISSFQSSDLFGQMRQSQIACLLVHGQNDPAIPAPPAESSVNLPDMMHQIVLKRSGHFPMLDEAARFNRLLIEFLTLDSGVSPRELHL